MADTTLFGDVRTGDPRLLPLHKHCPSCKNDVLMTLWQPPSGFNPTLREFYCQLCRSFFYIPVDPATVMRYKRIE